MASHIRSRRAFLKSMAAGAAGLGLTQRIQAEATPRSKPNILFIMADDLGPEWLRCYGGKEIETPHLDALAKGGMRFTNAYSMPQCTPSRVTLLTGQYPFRHGWVNHWDVPRWGAGCHFDWKHNASFARIMQSAGYVTAAAGKWQINDFRVQPDAMAKHGFDDWCMWTGYESDNPPSSERYWDPYINTPKGSRTHKGRFGTDVFVDFLIDFMKRHHDKPQMLYFPMALTHTPFTETPHEKRPRTKEDKFKAMVRYTDHSVGRLIGALDALKLRSDTIVIFCGDNGTTGRITARMNGREVRGGKSGIGENGCWTPFIVNAPGRVPAGVVTDALTDFTDMLPTFAELGGATLPEDMAIDGHSIAPVLLGKEKDSKREWILAMGAHAAKLTKEGVVPAQPYANRALRDKRYKLWVEDGNTTRLYDLQEDPGEKTNLIDSADPKHIDALKKLKTVLDTFPKRDAHPRYDPTPSQPWDKKIKEM